MDMMTRRILYWASALFFLACISATANFFLHIRSGPPHEWVTHTFAGKVVSVSSSTISVQDARATERLFMFSPQTVVRKGVSTVPLSALIVGQFVLVHAPPVPGTPNEAREIRVLTTDSVEKSQLKR